MGQFCRERGDEPRDQRAHAWAEMDAARRASRRRSRCTPRLLAVVPLYRTADRMHGGETVDEGPVRPVPLVYAGWQF